MRDKLKQKWIHTFFCVFLSAAMTLSIITYFADPFMYYRISDDKKLLNSRFVNMGLIKNYNYDTAIIGSSMIQNFDMQYFRENYSVKPVKLTVGGMTLNEILKMYQLSQEYSNTNMYIINVDLTQFTTSDSMGKNSSKFPEYLYNKNKLDDIKYLLGYEVWLRYYPVNTIINALYNMEFDLPEKFDDSTNIDKIGDFSKDYTFGKEIVIQNYLDDAYSTSSIEKKDLYSRMAKNIDTYFELIMKQKKSGQTIIFGFPPYSALYWHTTFKDDTFKSKRQIKHHLKS